MIRRDILIQYIHSLFGDDLLKIAKEKDKWANGVQIFGKENVQVVAVGVSVNACFLQKAVEKGADFCITHHGLNLTTIYSRLPLSLQRRLKIIFQNDLTIASYHYVLDAHKEIGNNVQIIQRLNAYVTQSICNGWGFIGEYKYPVSFTALQKRFETLTNHHIFSFKAHNRKIKRIAVLTGAGIPSPEIIEELLKNKVDVYLSGETVESGPQNMVESGISYLLGGHYATETFGIKKIKKMIQDKFQENIKVLYIDVPNPI